MSTPSSMTGSSGSASQAVNAAKEAAEKKVDAAAGTVQSELQSLQQEVSRLASQLAEATAAKGEAVWRRARESSADAADALRGVSSDVTEAVDESIRERPYISLALALGLGFVLGATWRR